MLLSLYESRVFRPPCDYGSEAVNARAAFAGDISPVFPYLNAIMQGAQYQAGVPMLRFRWDGHVVVLHSDKMAISGFGDGDAAVEGLARLRDLINETWEERDKIAPSTIERKRLNPMQVFQLLPRSNCRECGEPSCFVFASKLVVGEVDIEECTALRLPEYAELRQRLLAQLDISDLS